MSYFNYNESIFRQYNANNELLGRPIRRQVVPSVSPIVSYDQNSSIQVSESSQGFLPSRGITTASTLQIPGTTLAQERFSFSAPKKSKVIYPHENPIYWTIARELFIFTCTNVQAGMRALLWWFGDHDREGMFKILYQVIMKQRIVVLTDNFFSSRGKKAEHSENIRLDEKLAALLAGKFEVGNMINPHRERGYADFMNPVPEVYPVGADNANNVNYAAPPELEEKFEEPKIAAASMPGDENHEHFEELRIQATSSLRAYHHASQLTTEYLDRLPLGQAEKTIQELAQHKIHYEDEHAREILGHLSKIAKVKKRIKQLNDIRIEKKLDEEDPRFKEAMAEQEVQYASEYQSLIELESKKDEDFGNLITDRTNAAHMKYYQNRVNSFQDLQRVMIEKLTRQLPENPTVLEREVLREVSEAKNQHDLLNFHKTFGSKLVRFGFTDDMKSELQAFNATHPAIYVESKTAVEEEIFYWLKKASENGWQSELAFVLKQATPLLTSNGRDSEQVDILLRKMLIGDRGHFTDQSAEEFFAEEARFKQEQKEDVERREKKKRKLRTNCMSDKGKKDVKKLNKNAWIILKRKKKKKKKQQDYKLNKIEQTKLHIY